jgi:hypothetical protein
MILQGLAQAVRAWAVLQGREKPTA